MGWLGPHPYMSLQAFKRAERRLSGARRLFTTQVHSRRMAQVRQRGTAPEIATRHAARLAGLRYTTQNADLPGSPDLANRRRRIAIFVHGCYWHRHQGCSKATTPRTNRSFWLAKFRRNQQRDREAVRELRAAGYRVLVIWQCETQDPARIASRIRRMLE